MTGCSPSRSWNWLAASLFLPTNWGILLRPCRLWRQHLAGQLSIWRNVIHWTHLQCFGLCWILKIFRLKTRRQAVHKLQGVLMISPFFNMGFVGRVCRQEWRWANESECALASLHCKGLSSDFEPHLVERQKASQIKGCCRHKIFNHLCLPVCAIRIYFLCYLSPRFRTISFSSAYQISVARCTKWPTS